MKIFFKYLIFMLLIAMGIVACSNADFTELRRDVRSIVSTAEGGIA